MSSLQAWHSRVIAAGRGPVDRASPRHAILRCGRGYDSKSGNKSKSKFKSKFKNNFKSKLKRIESNGGKSIRPDGRAPFCTAAKTGTDQ
jgi:hypothetical protein